MDRLTIGPQVGNLPHKLSEISHDQIRDHLEVAPILGDHLEAEVQGGRAYEEIFEGKRDATPGLLARDLSGELGRFPW
jgi:hypothetical protein